MNYNVNISYLYIPNTYLNLPLPYLTILADPWHLGYLCWSFTLCVQVCALGMIPSAVYVIVTANCLMLFLPSKLFLTLTAPTHCHYHHLGYRWSHHTWVHSYLKMMSLAQTSWVVPCSSPLRYGLLCLFQCCFFSFSICFLSAFSSYSFFLFSFSSSSFFFLSSFFFNILM